MQNTEYQMENFEEKLKKAMIDQNLTQEKLQKIVKFSRQKLRNDLDRNDLWVSDLEKLSAALKVRMSYWWDETEPFTIREENTEYKRIQETRIIELKETVEIYKKQVILLEEKLQDCEIESKRAG
jgi:hypothetical protein